MIHFTDKKKKRLKNIQKFVHHMPSLSTTVTKALEICNSPNASPADLGRVISLDPVLTGQVLKLVNSAYYSLLEKITSPGHAITLLGLNTVKNIVLSTAILAGHRKKDLFQDFSTDDFWAHCICVGVTAKCLAGIKGISSSEREEYFVGGLVHDLGKIPLHGQFPDLYIRALNIVKAEQDPLHRAETTVFGFDHCSTGKLIAEKWRLGEKLYELLDCHHSPEAANEKNRQFITIISLANTYSNILEIGAAGDHFPEEKAPAELLQLAGIEWAELSGLRETVLEDIEKAKIFLQVTQ
jgi:HD-like signal output (HDOD) protein